MSKEAPEGLGQTLRLPPWLEPQRAEIQQILPKLNLPAAQPVA